MTAAGALRWQRVLVGLALGLLAAPGAEAQQGRSSFGNRGAFGSGSSVTGRQNSGFGQRSSFGQTGGTFGQSAFGNGQTGMGSGLGQGGMGQSALGGRGPMSEGLAQPAGDQFQEGGFVGRDAADVRQGFESTNGPDRRGMMDMMIENLNEMRESRRRWREQQSAPPPVRVKLQPAFDLPATSPLATATQLQMTLTRTLRARGVVSPQVEIAGRTAFLRGAVATAHDRELVERLASLEPGISRVENLLTIQRPAEVVH